MGRVEGWVGAVHARKSLQSCLALFDPMDYSQPGSSVHGILSLGKNTGVGCHAFLQGIFPPQGSSLRVMSPALAGMFFTISATWEAQVGADQVTKGLHV